MDWSKIRRPEDIIDAGKNKLGDFGKFTPWIIIALLALFGLKGFLYTIDPEEVGVVQRFGKYVRLSLPGLHAKIPFGIEKVTPVKIKRVFKEEFGVRTLRAGVRTQYSPREYLDESLMLTGDLNILDVRWIVQFRIREPIKLLFNVRNPVDSLRDVVEAVMRRFVGDYRVDEVLTTKREEVDILVQQEMQNILNKYESGIQVVTVKLLDVNPPEKVKPAFNEVNEAKQEREQMINQAWEAYNKAIPRARGEAERTIREAEGYSLDKINRAKGDAERFLSVLAEYKKAPEITQKRLYLETLLEVLPKAKEKYVIDPAQTSILPLLDIRKKGGE
ncbi:MAG: FtsH protease activity modulator HflK [Candidatus Omnitrophota bacterium]